MGIMRIEHSAISVADLAASRRFYEGLGLTGDERTPNRGPTQVALDGLDGVEVDIRAMNPTDAPPHIELLGYRRPVGRRHQPFAATMSRRRASLLDLRCPIAGPRRASPPTHPMRSIANRYCVAAMNKRRPSCPPKVQLDATAGVGMKPSLRRSGDQMCTPSAAVVQTQPRASTANPSG